MQGHPSFEAQRTQRWIYYLRLLMDWVLFSIFWICYLYSGMSFHGLRGKRIVLKGNQLKGLEVNRLKGMPGIGYFFYVLY